MQTTKAFAFLGFAGALFASTFSTPARAVTRGDNGTHDPSRMVESEGKFYVYSTGGSGKSSPDGLIWTRGAALFPDGFPQWLKTLMPSTQGVWAPDIIHLNSQYYLYYSVASGNSKKTCAIGLITSPTLDPSSKDYKWTDRGLVVTNDEKVTYATIDPAPVLDADNNLWLVWGGGYANPNDAQAIWVTRLDNMTGLPSAADSAKPGHPLLQGHKEGPYLHYHGGYYYVFWQTGGCCSGTASTYTIHVARSKSITGPYDGEKVFLASHDDVHGPGHIGIYNACGVERFTYHYYPSNGSILGENTLTWENDWPVAGPEATTPLEPCNGSPTPGTGGSETGGSAGATSVGGSTTVSGGSTNAGGVRTGGSSNGGATNAGSATVGALAGSNSAGTSSAGSNTAPDTLDEPSADAGCTCTTAAHGTSNTAMFGMAFAISVVARRRRQRRRAPVNSAR
jgi:beta-xylosidase